MNEQEYIENTSPMVNFLTSCLSADLELSVVIAQGNRNTQYLIDMLSLVKEQCDVWINDLKAMEEE